MGDGMGGSRAVGGTRDQWIEAWIKSEASASTSLFFWFKLKPRTRRGLSNFSKTQTQSLRVVFQNRIRTRLISRNIHTLPTPLNKLESELLGVFWTHMVNICTQNSRWEVITPPIPPSYHQPPLPPSSPPALFLCSRTRIFKCLWGPGIDSKEWIQPADVARAGIFKEARNQGRNHSLESISRLY